MIPFNLLCSRVKAHSLKDNQYVPLLLILEVACAAQLTVTPLNMKSNYVVSGHSISILNLKVWFMI